MAATTRIKAFLLFLLAHAALLAWAEKNVHAHAAASGPLTLEGLDERLQACPVVQDLTAQKLAAAAAAGAPTTSAPRILEFFFPSASPAVNALLATAYISGPPNLLLALCPPDVDPSTLSVMVAFAVGGLLGDTLFHLLPEIFVGEDEPEAARFVLVEPRRNLVLGAGILVGLLAFVAMDKGLRIATGGGGHDHGRGDGHVHGDCEKEHETNAASSSAAEAIGGKGLRSRKTRQPGKEEAAASSSLSKEAPSASGQSAKLGGYLNLIADFTHNITDGLAMSASFYASPTVGATTALAVFFHEIPHEVGDFALLVQSGFSKRAAMGAQFVTAIGALLGTLIGIAVQELGGRGEGAVGRGAEGVKMGEGIFGTSLSWGDMLLPFTAGTFLYVGTVAVIPELLETGPNKAAELKKMFVQFLAIFSGAGIMMFISWQE